MTDQLKDEMEAISINKPKFATNYYVVAMLFAIFQLFVVLLASWIISLNNIGVFGFISISLFITIICCGFIYLYCKGAFKWR